LGENSGLKRAGLVDVLPRIVVVEDDFYNLVGFENELVGVGTVDVGIGCVGAGG
jgi:hypothetical protein